MKSFTLQKKKNEKLKISHRNHIMIAQKCRGQVEINSKWDEKKEKKMEIKAEDIHKNLHIYRVKLKRKGERGYIY